MNRRGIIIFAVVFISSFLMGQETYTISSYVQEVLEKDFQVAFMKNEVEIAANENNIGAAGYLPRISLDATRDISIISSARQEFLGGQVNEIDDAQNRSFDAGALLEWTIFDGFKMFATDKKLNYLEETAQLNLRAEVEMKAYEASVAFYTYLLLQQQRNIYQKAIDLSKARLKYTENKRDNGAATRLELEQAKMDLTADSAIFMNNEYALKKIVNQLNTLIAKPADAHIEIEGNLPEHIERKSWENFQETAEANNTSLLLAKSNLAVRNYEKKEVLSRFYPQLGVYANYNFQTAQNEVGFLLNNRVAGPGFGVTLRWDILDQLSRVQELKNARIREANAELLQEQEELFINAELKDAFEQFNWAEKNVSFELRNRVAAEDIAGIAQRSFEAGTLTPIELREIQFGIVEAENRLLAAQLEYVTARLNLSLITGEWEL